MRRFVLFLLLFALPVLALEFNNDTVIVEGIALAGGGYGMLSDSDASGTWTGNNSEVGDTDVFDTSAVDGTIVTADLSDGTNDHLIIGASGAGLYYVNFSISFTGGNALTYSCHIYSDSSTATTVGWSRKLGTGADVGCAMGSGILTFAAADEPQVKCSASGAATDMGTQDLHFSIYRIG
jgi:hypothetical protein